MVSIGPIHRRPIAVKAIPSSEPTPSAASERLSAPRVSRIEEFLSTHVRTATPEILPPLLYVIYSDSESDGGEPLFWSNQDGWVSFSSATRFTPIERYDVAVPMSTGDDARWVQFADAMAFVRSFQGS